MDWDEALALSQSGEVLILPFLNQTPAREEWLLFTEPLLVNPNVFITREEHSFITDAAQLVDTVMVLPSGTSAEEWVRRDFLSDIEELVSVARKVSTDEYTIFIGALFAVDIPDGSGNLNLDVSSDS